MVVQTHSFGFCAATIGVPLDTLATMNDISNQHNQEYNSSDFRDRLERLREMPSPQKVTKKQVIADNFEEIEACLAEGKTFDRIALTLNEGGLDIAVATLRRYLYDLRKRSEGEI